MFGFFVILCCMAAGVLFGVLVIIGSMLYSGKWTVPGTDQRRLQREKVNLQIAELKVQQMQAELFRTQVQGNLDLEYTRQRSLEMGGK